MIKQLRPFYAAEELAELYAKPYDHTKWPEHVARVEHTQKVLTHWGFLANGRTVADLSCGDGAIVTGSRWRWEEWWLGDIAPTIDTWLSGPIKQTIERIPVVDFFVCSETLEHVERPAELLTAIRRKARHLLLTTPHAEWDDGNREHYWGWDAAGIGGLLGSNGWTARHFELFSPGPNPYYTYQIWVAS